jgi:hypothetical protein
VVFGKRLRSLRLGAVRLRPVRLRLRTVKGNVRGEVGRGGDVVGNDPVLVHLARVTFGPETIIII